MARISSKKTNTIKSIQDKLKEGYNKLKAHYKKELALEKKSTEKIKAQITKQKNKYKLLKKKQSSASKTNNTKSTQATKQKSKIATQTLNGIEKDIYNLNKTLKSLRKQTLLLKFDLATTIEEEKMLSKFRLQRKKLAKAMLSDNDLQHDTQTKTKLAKTPASTQSTPESVSLTEKATLVKNSSETPAINTVTDNNNPTDEPLKQQTHENSIEYQ